MNLDTWTTVLAGTLLVNAALAFGYRVYRLSKGGPMGDVIGQAALASLLVAIALGLATGATWLRWFALGYAVLFGILVMPVWTLAILVPMDPRPIDYGFTAAYWGSLVLIGVAAVLS